MLLREGWTYVHVSAQKAGLCCIPLTPQVCDPVRYAAINHPGDQYSADMLSQIALAMRSHQGLDPMKGLTVEAGDRGRAVAVRRQALRLRHPVAGPGRRDRRVPDPRQRHREEDVPGAARRCRSSTSCPTARPSPRSPPRTANYRLWEVAGTAHSDYFIGHQSVLRQRPAGRRACPPWTAPATTRSSTRPATTGRSSTRSWLPASSPEPPCRCTTPPARPCTSSTAGSGPASARPGHRATSSPAPSWPRTSTATRSAASGMPPIEVPVATLREHRLRARRPHRPVRRRQDPGALPELRPPTSGSWRRRRTGRYAAAGCSRRTRAT